MELDISLIEDMLYVTGWTSYHTYLFFNSFFTYFFPLLWITHLTLFSSTFSHIWNLTSLEISFLICSFQAGMACGGLICGYLSDTYGRNYASRRSVFVSFTFSFLSIFVRSYEVMMVCCIGMGLGIGGELVNGGVILSEYLPRNGGYAVVLSSTGIGAGSIVGIGLYISILEGNVLNVQDWRVAFAVNCVVELGVLMMRLRMEETPKYLWKKDRHDEAEKVIEMVGYR